MFELTNKHIYQITYHLTPVYNTEKKGIKDNKTKYFTSEFRGNLCDVINTLLARTHNALGNHILGIDYIKEKSRIDEI